MLMAVSSCNWKSRFFKLDFDSIVLIVNHLLKCEALHYEWVLHFFIFSIASLCNSIVTPIVTINIERKKGESKVDWIYKRATLSGNKTALVDIEAGKTLTYSELIERVNKWVTFFISKQIKKGDRIATLALNQVEQFEVMFACRRIGAIYVPLNWRLSAFELEYIIKDCSPKIVLFHDRFEELIQQIRLDECQFYSFRNTILGNESHAVVVKKDFSDLDPWLIIYTGGTTGKPKGVVLANRSVDWNAINTIISWGLTEHETTLTYMPLFHTGGINALSLPILMNGGTVVIGNQFNPSEALKYLDQYKCTISLFVPTMHHMMQQTEEFHSLDLSNHLFLSGGAPCPLIIYERYAKKGYRFKEGYGLTEAGPNNFVITPEVALVKKGSVGKPMMFNEVKVVKKDGTEAGPNEVGELLIRGNHAFIEYWHNSDATSETLVNGWLYTGDLVKKDEDGYFYIVGRKKDMIITGGENVYPLEIEQWLCEHEYIDEAAVVGIPDEKWGEKVTAFITLTGIDNLSDEELIQYCKQRLAHYKVPKLFVILKELPKTHVGKIDKKALKGYFEVH